jgi:hypothetical protein
MRSSLDRGESSELSLAEFIRKVPEAGDGVLTGFEIGFSASGRGLGLKCLFCGGPIGLLEGSTAFE